MTTIIYYDSGCQYKNPLFTYEGCTYDEALAFIRTVKSFKEVKLITTEELKEAREGWTNPQWWAAEWERWTITHNYHTEAQSDAEPQQDMLPPGQYAKAVDECMYGEPKPVEWSEEDDRMFQHCVAIVSTNVLYENSAKEMIYDWLKSLNLRSSGSRAKNK